MKKLIVVALFMNVVLLAGRFWQELSVSAEEGTGAGEIPVGNGDVNASGVIDISDASYLLNWLFLGGPRPVAIAQTGGNEVSEFRIRRPDGGGTLFFGPQDDRSVGVEPGQGPKGLLLTDPDGIRLLNSLRGDVPSLIFGPTDECRIRPNPENGGLVIWDPQGLGIQNPRGEGQPSRLSFGPSGECRLGVGPADGPGGLLLEDPLGIRLLNPGPGDVPSLIFGPTDECRIRPNPENGGLVVWDPQGLGIQNPQGEGQPSRLSFGPSGECRLGIGPADGPGGLLLEDPLGIRFLNPINQLQRGIQQRLPVRVFWGPTDDCSISTGGPNEPNGLLLRDPAGLRLLNPNNEPSSLLFGPTDECRISPGPRGEGLILFDPKGVRILNSQDEAGPSQILFGPTDECTIGVEPSAQTGMMFTDPNGFFFNGGPVFASEFGEISSARHKRNCRPIDDALEKIEKLEGVYFSWTEEFGGENDLGLLAEEVAKVVPEVVSYEADGETAKGLSYTRLVPLAIEGIKSHQGEIKRLEEENLALRKEIDALQNSVSVLAERVENLAQSQEDAQAH